MQVLSALGRLASTTGIRVVDAIRFLLIAADAGLLVAADRWMASLGVPRRRLVLLAGFALNPICILLTCQHGNFDVLVALAIVLFLLWIGRFLEGEESDAWLVSSLFLGAGVVLKGAPAILAPLAASGARRLTAAARALGVALVFGPAIYGLSVIFALAPSEATRSVLRYRSISGWFGVTGFLHWLRLDAAIPYYFGLFALGLVAAAAAAGIALWRAAIVTPRRLLLTALLLLIAIPFLGGGYGPQYLLWFWPLLLAAVPPASARLHWAAAIFAGAALGTYLGQYALMESLGSFLLWKTSDPSLPLAAIVLRSNRAAALSSTPLFASYAILFAAIVRELANEVRAGAVPQSR